MLFFLFTILKKIEIRERMKGRLVTEQLQTIILPEQKVKWMDKHEIWVNDHMFDIHSKRLEHGVYTFTGLYDKEETMMVKKQHQTSEKDLLQNKLLTQLFKCVQGFYSTPVQEAGLLISIQDHLLLRSFPGAVEQFKEILTPPPQV